MSKDKFYFFSRSASKPPGKGNGKGFAEYVSDESKYKKLSKIENWRHMLSNFYISPFVLDDEKWNSVEHFFHAVKFRDDKNDGPNYDFYKTFTIKSGYPWSLNPIFAKQAGKAGRITEKTKKVYTKKIGNIKIPTNVSMRSNFYSTGIDTRLQTIAFFAKFTQNKELCDMLLETKDAELWHYVGRGAPNQLWLNLMKVRDCIKKFMSIYDLKNISKFSSEIVSKIFEDKL